MEEQIDIDTFNHLVDLASLELEPGEAEYIRKQLNNQLNAIHELEAIPINSGTQLTSHGVPFTPEISPELRQDTWIPSQYPDAILKQAPQTEERYFIVPEIPHTTLE